MNLNAWHSGNDSGRKQGKKKKQSNYVNNGCI